MRLFYLWCLGFGCTETPEKTEDQADVELDSAVSQGGDDEQLAPFSCMYIEEQQHGDSGIVAIGVEIIAENLMTPWGIDWLPNGEILMTERDGVISKVSAGGQVNQIATVASVESGEGGLLGLALDPDFANNHWFYIYYTTNQGGQKINRVARWKLATDLLSAAEDRVIVDNIDARQFHNGGRLRIGPDNKLYIGTGDAGSPEKSQDVSSLAGKILRVNLDGTIPVDNPYPNEATYISGIRNTQGFDWVDDEQLLITDHGPSGLPNENGRSDHDEVTLASPGANLGWPTTFACEEGDGFSTASITWSNAMPPGGAAIYRGTEIPEWQGSLLIGVLGMDEETPHLHRLELDAVGNVLVNEVYLHGQYGRLREISMGPDGGLYVTTSNCDGRGTCAEGDMILRIGGAQ